MPCHKQIFPDSGTEVHAAVISVGLLHMRLQLLADTRVGGAVPHWGLCGLIFPFTDLPSYFQHDL